MTSRRIAVNPQVMRWARATSKMSSQAAAKRIGVKPERLERWESGSLEPTINQVRTAARVYSRPFSALLVSEPPEWDEVSELPDFRRSAINDTFSAALQKSIVRAKNQCEIFNEVIADGVETPFVMKRSFTLEGTNDAETAGRIIREALGLANISAATTRNPTDFLRTLVKRVEELGSLVVQVQRVPRDEMRGFSIVGNPISVIALNGSDWPRGKIFTLIHELVHILRRRSGLCDLEGNATAVEERFCDAATASTLMPAEKFQHAYRNVPNDDYSELRSAADEFGVSAEAGLIRMVELGKASWDDYFYMKPFFEHAYAQFRRDAIDERGDRAAPIFYQLKVRDLGRPFIDTVLRAHDDGLISSRDVTSILEVSYDKLPKLASQSGYGVRAL